MGFRVVDQSTFTFATDLPPASRNIHPSGVLHAFRTTPRGDAPPPPPPGADAPSSGQGALAPREEHAFAWITNSLHVELAMKHLETHGFDRNDGIVFIPYSTKANWLDRYPHAAPALETNDAGKVVVYLNWRPYPNGLGQLGGTSDGTAAGEDAGAAVQPMELDAVATDVLDVDDDASSSLAPSTAGKRRRSSSARGGRLSNILQDPSCLPDPERDELHVEIYRYFSWLHGRLDAIERKALAAAMAKEQREAASKIMASATTAAAAAAAGEGPGLKTEDGLPPPPMLPPPQLPPLPGEASADDGKVGGDQGAGATAAEGEENNAGGEGDEESKVEGSGGAPAAIALRSKNLIPGVDVSELRELVSKLESTFAVIPNIKMEEEEASAAAAAVATVKLEGEGEGGDTAEAAAQPVAAVPVVVAQPPKGDGTVPAPPPFLEEALSKPLGQLVAARELAGKPRRRSRKRQRRKSAEPSHNRGHSRVPKDFDEMFERLKAYKEQHGDTLVSKNYKGDESVSRLLLLLCVIGVHLETEPVPVHTLPSRRPFLASVARALGARGAREEGRPRPQGHRDRGGRAWQAPPGQVAHGRARREARFHRLRVVRRRSQGAVGGPVQRPYGVLQRQRKVAEPVHGSAGGVGAQAARGVHAQRH